MTRKLRPKERSMAIIAREVALIPSSLSFPPKVDHTPGVAHTLADLLRRASADDDYIFNTHPELAGAARAVPAQRNRMWYKALKIRPLNSF